MNNIDVVAPMIEEAASVLDFELEHWEDMVAIGGFGIHDAKGCLLHRLYGSWSDGMDKLSSVIPVHGSICPFACDKDEEPMYIEIWTKEIVKRRLNAVLVDA